MQGHDRTQHSEIMTEALGEHTGKQAYGNIPNESVEADMNDKAKCRQAFAGTDLSLSCSTHAIA